MKSQSAPVEESVPVSDDDASANSRPAKRGVPEGLWLKCPGCRATIFRKQVDRLLGICPECEYHFYVPARTRIEQLLDIGSFEEWFAEMRSVDPLGFVDSKSYKVRLTEEQKKTELVDACVTGRGYMRGRSVVITVTDY
ncbi:MAG: acetyl-CoA carboxylase carboxyl transferase subunit beta, partial [Planctomycetaceae bacterium]|nr:acetyl-CoA carboxylase carboxyl transferase subunit beta [Planctomycetaceae bacterium]